MSILQFLPWRRETWTQIIAITSNPNTIKMCMKYRVEHRRVWKQKELKLIKL